MSVKPRALVIGGGIAGPAAALFLQKAGYDAVVFEAYPERTAAGGALAVAPNGMNVMGELGLADSLIAAGTIIDRFSFRTRRGRHLGSMAYAPEGRYRFPGVSLARATFYTILLDALAERRIALTYGKRLTAIDEDAGGVVARFADGTVERGDILIGADGIWSTVRALILPDAPRPLFTGLIGAGGLLPRSTMMQLVGFKDENTMTFCFGDGAFFGYAFGDRRQDNGAYWWHALARDNPLSDAERQAFSGERGVAALLAAGDGWFAGMRDIVTATTTHIAPLNLFDVAGLPRWHSGRVVLVGDAAHAVSPHSGQGASMALEGAIVLANMLRANRAEPEAAFASYERERRSRAERVIELGRRSGSQKQKGRLGSLLQTLAMPLFVRLAPAPRWLYGYEPRWE